MEKRLVSELIKWDTDGGGVSDGVEWNVDGTNPIDNPGDDNIAANDDDSDGLTNVKRKYSAPTLMTLTVTMTYFQMDMK